MDELTQAALAYLRENWHIGIAGAAEAAELLAIKPNTLKTRLARGQALVLRDAGAAQRSPLSFTGYHLVHNYLADRLLRFGFPSDDGEFSVTELATTYAMWAFDNVVCPPHSTGAFLVFDNSAGFGASGSLHFDPEYLRQSEDAGLIIPIGNVVARIAQLLHLRRTVPAQAATLVATAD